MPARTIEPSSMPPSSAVPPMSSAIGQSSSPRRTPRPRQTLDPLAMDGMDGAMDEDTQENTQRSKRPRARNLVTTDVPQVRDTSGEALVLLMEQFINE